MDGKGKQIRSNWDSDRDIRFKPIDRGDSEPIMERSGKRNDAEWDLFRQKRTSKIEAIIAKDGLNDFYEQNARILIKKKDTTSYRLMFRADDFLLLLDSKRMKKQAVNEKDCKMRELLNIKSFLVRKKDGDIYIFDNPYYTRSGFANGEIEEMYKKNRAFIYELKKKISLSPLDEYRLTDDLIKVLLVGLHEKKEIKDGDEVGFSILGGM